MGCPWWVAERGIKDDSPSGTSSRIAPCARLNSPTAERMLRDRQGDSCPTEADPGIKDSSEHEKSRLFE